MAAKPFPAPGGMTPFWRTSPGHLDTHRSTEALPQECDILIIGAGYSGASLLTHLLTQDESAGKSILVLEARQLCSGATGRNGGHMKPNVYSLAPSLYASYGVDAVAEIAEFELANLAAVREYVRTTGADCDLIITESVDVQLSEKHNESVKSQYEEIIGAGAEVAKSASYIHGEDAETVSGVNGAKGAFKCIAGHLWPYKLVHHMFAQALASTRATVNLQTNTPVTKISVRADPAGRWEIHTARGKVLANQVIMATNAYTAALLPEYQDKIIPYRGVCSHIVAPGPKPLPVMSNTYSLRFNEWDYDYLIPRADGSIIVGGSRRTYLRHLEDWYGNVDDTKMIERAEGYFDGYMQRHFKGWEDTGAYTENVWTGIMGYSSDRLPHLGKVPGRNGMFIMGGFTGHGMPQIFLAAKGLSEMVLGGRHYAETGLPRLFEETAERLESEANWVLDLHARLPPE